MTPYQLKQLLNQLSLLDLHFLCYDVVPTLYLRITTQTPPDRLIHWLMAETTAHTSLIAYLKKNHVEAYTTCLRLRPTNPFVFGSYLSQIEQFFGRQRLLRELKATLQGFQNIALHGQTRMGRSSLLYHLHLTRAQWLPPGVRLAYVDLQTVWDEQELFAVILERLRVLPPHNRTTFRQYLEQNRVILLLDDVEYLANNADFNPRLQSYLRGFGSKPTVALCMATKIPLADLFPDPTGGHNSPLHNIFIKKSLPPFSLAELRQLLQSRLAESGLHFSSIEINTILEQCHGSPARLQELAYQLFDQKLKEQYS